MTSRTHERSDLDDPMRIRLAEGDLDDHEEAIERLSGQLGKILWVLIGVLISTTTASIMLALNLTAIR